jgi:hypothetical protein
MEKSLEMVKIGSMPFSFLDFISFTNSLSISYSDFYGIFFFFTGDFDDFSIRDSFVFFSNFTTDLVACGFADYGLTFTSFFTGDFSLGFFWMAASYLRSSSSIFLRLSTWALVMGCLKGDDIFLDPKGDRMAAVLGLDFP